MMMTRKEDEKDINTKCVPAIRFNENGLHAFHVPYTNS